MTLQTRLKELINMIQASIQFFLVSGDQLTSIILEIFKTIIDFLLSITSLISDSVVKNQKLLDILFKLVCISPMLYIAIK